MRRDSPFKRKPRMIYVLQHIHCETLGTIADALQKQSISFRYIRSFQGEPVPKTMEGADGLIVMGGPMGVYEEERYPFLLEEMRLIEKAVRAGKPVLGVCLGSQLLAKTLGAAVTKGKKKEIGWFPVYLNKEAGSDVLLSGVSTPVAALHWHGDIFELPKNATILASSDLTAVQAFRYGKNAHGFLFHLEATREMTANWVSRFAGELRAEHLNPAGILNNTENRFDSLQKTGAVIFGHWAQLVKGH